MVGDLGVAGHAHHALGLPVCAGLRDLEGASANVVSRTAINDVARDHGTGRRARGIVEIAMPELLELATRGGRKRSETAL